MGRNNNALNRTFLTKLQSLNQIIRNLNEKNIPESVQSIIGLFNRCSYSLSFVISQLIYMSFLSQKKNFDIYLCFLKEIQSNEQENQRKIIYTFAKFLNNLKTFESNYLLFEMIEQKIIESKIISNKKSLYFVNYNTEETKNMEYDMDDFDDKYIKIFWEYFNSNLEILKKNDWEVHKKLIKEGHNPNEIAQIIRNDEIEKLQEISSQTNFDFNQTIEPSLYERCSFINKENVTLIDYAAFFSSVKCFKYLLMNGANIENAGKYAVAGGNEEITHLCEQNHSSFEGSYEAAIEYHRNNLFHYLYENEIIEINSLDELGKVCVSYHNYEILSFLLENGMEINDAIIYESAKIGNIFLLKYLLIGKNPPKFLLHYAIESGNSDLVNFVYLKTNINGKGVNLFCILFIFMY